MGRRIIFFIFTFLPAWAFSQHISFLVLHDSVPVPYVSVIDSASGIFGYTNEHGLLTVNSGNYSVKFLHVSYRDAFIRIKRPIADSLVTVQLTARSVVLDTISLTSVKIDRKKIFSEGAYNRPSSNGMTDRLHSFIGMSFDETPESPKYLRSIKFRLHKNDFRKYPFVLEFKLYGINSERMLSQAPLNTKPIYIRSQDLGRKNEIIITEKIRIPDDGIFVSCELPEKFEDEFSNTINFMATSGTTKSITYFTHDQTGQWQPEILHTKGMSLPLEDKPFIELCWSITYWKAK